MNVDGSNVRSALLIGAELDAATPFEASIKTRKRFPHSGLIGRGFACRRRVRGQPGRRLPGYRQAPGAQAAGQPAGLRNVSERVPAAYGEPTGH